VVVLSAAAQHFRIQRADDGPSSTVALVLIGIMCLAIFLLFAGFLVILNRKEEPVGSVFDTDFVAKRYRLMPKDGTQYWVRPDGNVDYRMPAWLGGYDQSQTHRWHATSSVDFSTPTATGQARRSAVWPASEASGAIPPSRPRDGREPVSWRSVWSSLGHAPPPDRPKPRPRPAPEQRALLSEIERDKLVRMTSVPSGVERGIGLGEEGEDLVEFGCQICFSEKTEIVFLPCRHGALCELCCRHLLAGDHMTTYFERRKARKCPQCRSRISEILRVEREPGGAARFGYTILID